MKVYLSGVMQGSRKDEYHVSQDYRKTIKNIILKRFPFAEIICPLEEFPNASFDKTISAEKVIVDCALLAATSDLIVAFLPEASMGTAVELWEAYKNSKPVITISPMAHNLVIKTVSDAIVPDLEGFERIMTNGEIEKILSNSFHIEMNAGKNGHSRPDLNYSNFS